MDARWLQYKALWAGRKIKKKVTKTQLRFDHYGDRNILDIDEAGRRLFESIKEGGPFMAGRFGSVELYAMEQFEKKHSLKQNAALDRLTTNAGFFPRDKAMAAKFAARMRESCGQVDMLGVWFNKMEDYMVERYAPDASLCHLRGLEPWYGSKPWTAALMGKRVLVIHPFAQSILSQYEKREALFPGTDILPSFQLQVLPAVQTIAGQADTRFPDWFAALDWMEREALEKEFDVALLGCGAYGFPLAARIKQAGRQAVHLGGATQLLFGIKGNRWENHPVISKLFNPAWVRPRKEERPPNAEKVEGACYW